MTLTPTANSHRRPLRALARAELQRARGGAHACDAPAAVAQPTALRSIGEVTLDGPEVNATSSTTSTLNHNTQHGTTPPHCYRKHEGRGAPSGTMTGTVPATIGTRSQPMMPVSTEVGQSGPPTRIMVLPTDMPGRNRSSQPGGSSAWEDAQNTLYKRCGGA